MKHLLLLSLFALFLFTSCQNTKENTVLDAENELPTSTYDSIAAAKYGADAYGMKKYVMAFLKRGTNDSISTEDAAKLQNEHMKNIGRMAEEGKLVLAGPFMDNGDLRGIYIFDVETLAEAEALTNTDPAIQQGVLSMELKEWYGSAAVMAINDIHTTLSKESVVE